MRAAQQTWRPEVGWQPECLDIDYARVSLVWLFGAPEVLSHDRLREIHERYPAAAVVGCSTAGEVHGTTVTDHGLVATALEFDSTRVETRHATITHPDQSAAVGHALAAQLPVEGLRHVVVLSDGLLVNGSALTRGLVEALPTAVSVTGGLAGDGPRFHETRVVGPDTLAPGVITAVGFYGDRLDVGCASLGGWDPFGPERTVTRADGNVLYELDGKSALDLYKAYLGEKARELPASGLLFPLAIRTGDATPVVRTILGVDDATGSITFAGDIPVGSLARLMKANFDRLIEGARGAATTSRHVLGGEAPVFALLISCVGRKLVLGQRTEEEVEGVREVVGDRAVLGGFYSYGEISPFTPGATCELHNQTMTITTFAERSHAPAA